MWINTKYQAEAPRPADGPPADRGRRLATFERGQGDQELRVSLNVCEGHPFVGAWIWTLNRATGVWWPSKKGVTIRIREIPDLIAALTEVLASENETRPARPEPTLPGFAPPRARSSATPTPPWTVPSPQALAPGRVADPADGDEPF